MTTAQDRALPVAYEPAGTGRSPAELADHITALVSSPAQAR
jgi:hypothetical protein